MSSLKAYLDNPNGGFLSDKYKKKRPDVTRWAGTLAVITGLKFHSYNFG